MRGGRSVTSRWTGQAREAQIWESPSRPPSVPVASLSASPGALQGTLLPMISFIPNNLPNQKEYLWKPGPREVPKATQRVGEEPVPTVMLLGQLRRRQTDRTGEWGAVWAGWDPSPDGGLSRSRSNVAGRGRTSIHWQWQAAHPMEHPLWPALVLVKLPYCRDASPAGQGTVVTPFCRQGK